MSDSAPVLERYLRAKVLADIALNNIHGVKLSLWELTGSAEIRKQIDLLDTEIKKLVFLVDRRVNDSRKAFDKEVSEIDLDEGEWEVPVKPKSRPKRKKKVG